MRALPPPDPALWRARAEWFWRAHDANAGPHALDLAPQAATLLGEMEAVFCAGAWAATVVLAWTLVEGEARAAERAAARRGEEPSTAPDIDWLRERRNRLAHAGGDELPDEAELKAWAEGAVRVAFKALFAGAYR
ncbi:MAG: hypothetical protein HY057_01305 [Rhodospirillales bacterium]|nr:hypothetical protein [Rhodospirillales bacterium]